MDQITCPACSTRFEPSRDGCPLCGRRTQESDIDTPDGVSATTAHEATADPTDLSVRYPALRYQLAVAFCVGYTVFGMSSLLVGEQLLFGFAVLLFCLSNVFLYLDLRSLDVRFYGVPPIGWFVGATLLYFLVVPLYVFKRSRHQREPR